MGVSIIVDTNAFYIKKVQDFTKVQFFNKITKLIDNIELNKYKTKVKIVFPQIVLDELLEHQIEEYREFCNNFWGCKFPGYKGISSDMLSIDDYEKYIREGLEYEIEELGNRDVKIEIIALDTNFDFNKLVKRAIKKNPPFEGKDKVSDKGFKDAVLWETLLYYKEKEVNRDEKIILYSNDKIFDQEKILEEFNGKFHEKLILADWHKKDKDLFINLNNLFNTDSKLSKELEITTKFRELITEHKILDLLHKINYKEEINDNTYKILNVISMYTEEIGDVIEYTDQANKHLFKFNVSLALIVGLINETKYDLIDLSLASLFDDIKTNKEINIEVFYNDKEKLIYIESVFINGTLVNVNPRYILTNN